MSKITNTKLPIIDLSIDIGSSRTKADYRKKGENSTIPVVSQSSLVYFDSIISYNDDKKDFQFDSDFRGDSNQIYIFKDLIQYCFLTVVKIDSVESDDESEEAEDKPKISQSQEHVPVTQDDHDSMVDQSQNNHQEEEDDDDDEEDEDEEDEEDVLTKPFDDFVFSSLKPITGKIHYTYQKGKTKLFFKKYSIMDISSTSEPRQFFYCPSFEITHHGKKTLVSLFEVFLFIIRNIIKATKARLLSNIIIENLVLHYPEMESCQIFYRYLSRFMRFVFNFGEPVIKITLDNFENLTLSQDIIKDCMTTTIKNVVIVNESHPFIPSLIKEHEKSFQVIDLGSYTIDSSIVTIETRENKKVFKTQNVQSKKIGYYDLLFMIYMECKITPIGKSNIGTDQLKLMYPRNKNLNPKYNKITKNDDSDYIISMIVDEEKSMLRQIGRIIESNQSNTNKTESFSITTSSNVLLLIELPSEDELKKIYSSYTFKIREFIFPDGKAQGKMVYVLTGGGFRNNMIMKSIKTIMEYKYSICGESVQEKYEMRLSSQSLIHMKNLSESIKYDWTNDKQNKEIVLDLLWHKPQKQYINEEHESENDLMSQLFETEQHDEDQSNETTDSTEIKTAASEIVSLFNDKEEGDEMDTTLFQKAISHIDELESIEKVVTPLVQEESKGGVEEQMRLGQDPEEISDESDAEQDEGSLCMEEAEQMQEIRKHKFSLYIPSINTKKDNIINKNYVFKTDDEVQFSNKEVKIMEFDYNKRSDNRLSIIQESKSSASKHLIAIIRLKYFKLKEVIQKVHNETKVTKNSITEIINAMLHIKQKIIFKVVYQCTKQQENDSYPLLKISAKPLFQNVAKQLKTKKKVTIDKSVIGTVLKSIKNNLRSDYTLDIQNLENAPQCFDSYPKFYEPVYQDNQDEKKDAKKYFDLYCKAYRNIVPDLSRKMDMFETEIEDIGESKTILSDHSEVKDSSSMLKNIFDNLSIDTQSKCMHIEDHHKDMERIDLSLVKNMFSEPKPFYIFDTISKMEKHSLGDWLMKDGASRFKSIIELIADKMEKKTSNQKKMESELSSIILSYPIVMQIKGSSEDTDSDSDMIDDSSDDNFNSSMRHPTFQQRVDQTLSFFIENQKKCSKDPSKSNDMLDFTRTAFGRTVIIWYVLETMLYGAHVSVPSCRHLFGTCVGVQLKHTVVEKLMERELLYTDAKGEHDALKNDVSEPEIVYKSFSFNKHEIQIFNKQHGNTCCVMSEDEKDKIETMNTKFFNWFEMKFMYKGMYLEKTKLFCRMLSRDNNVCAPKSIKSETMTMKELCIIPRIPISNKVKDTESFLNEICQSRKSKNSKSKKSNFMKQFKNLLNMKDSPNADHVNLSDCFEPMIETIKNNASGDTGNRYECFMNSTIDLMFHYMKPIHQTNDSRIRNYEINFEPHSDMIMETTKNVNYDTPEKYLDHVLCYSRFIKIKEPFLMVKKTQVDPSKKRIRNNKIIYSKHQSRPKKSKK